MGMLNEIDPGSATQGLVCLGSLPRKNTSFRNMLLGCICSWIKGIPTVVDFISLLSPCKTDFLRAAVFLCSVPTFTALSITE
ncbi:hypothetical protein GOBAR_AA32149 [Gossypium barbadense]|uniref:Uncharacterized protein n=1 Tax=Gossypium barbadense TaxID=3634 RepID=A0A2P5WBS7_GOSBA|nr:hypothetical protein GOBAR_AA32149 [Gossypium barbadense]